MSQVHETNSLSLSKTQINYKTHPQFSPLAPQKSRGEENKFIPWRGTNFLRGPVQCPPHPFLQEPPKVQGKMKKSILSTLPGEQEPFPVPRAPQSWTAPLTGGIGTHLRPSPSQAPVVVTWSRMALPPPSSCGGREVHMWVSSPAASFSLTKLGTLKTDNTCLQQNEGHVLLSFQTGQCGQLNQISDQFLVKQNRHKDVTGHP